MNWLVSRHGPLEARKAVIKELEEIKFLLRLEKMDHQLSPERTGVSAELRLSTQWFRRWIIGEKCHCQPSTQTISVEFTNSFQRYLPSMDGNVHDNLILVGFWWGRRLVQCQW